MHHHPKTRQTTPPQKKRPRHNYDDSFARKNNKTFSASLLLLLLFCLACCSNNNLLLIMPTAEAGHFASPSLCTAAHAVTVGGGSCKCLAGYAAVRNNNVDSGDNTYKCQRCDTGTYVRMAVMNTADTCADCGDACIDNEYADGCALDSPGTCRACQVIS